jgi:hypothetical protein
MRSSAALLGMLLFATLPATSNYQLQSYGFGSGGTAKSSTTTYSLEGTTGELSGQTGSTSNTSTKPGFIQTEQANVPKLAALDNNGGLYYNKLHFVIDNQNNPSDATFLIAVSTDNFATNLTYVQPDGTLSSTLSTADYQTYAAWGGSSGSVMIGLLPGTRYYVKLRATQGKFTESAYGPVTSQATANPSLSFSLVTSTQSTPPFSVGLGTLTAGSIATSGQTINTSLTTNGASGGDVYIGGQNGGLKSASTGGTIGAVSNDLSSVSEGFGAQNSSVGQTSGGPFTVLSPYNGSGNTVGIVSGTLRSLYTSATPVTAGSGVLLLKAKSATTDVAATDYQEILTFVAAANF